MGSEKYGIELCKNRVTETSAKPYQVNVHYRKDCNDINKL